MIKVLVVEDSLVVREFLVHILGSDRQVQVVGTARNGQEAIELLDEKSPDVITMDINMPIMNGFETTRRIMETAPTPIVIVSGSWDTKAVATTYRAMEAGALAVVARPAGIGHPDHEATAKELVRTVKLMSEIKVLRRWARIRQREAASTLPQGAVGTAHEHEHKDIRIVAIGASTGGPPAIQKILCGLPKDPSVPVLIVQHIAAGFIKGFAEWLHRSSGLRVCIPADGDRMAAGSVYVAPDGVHMKVGFGDRIVLSKDETVNGLCPSVSALFQSVSEVYGPGAVGVLLTGMGKDGARDLKLMKDRGALTIAQNRETSVVHGMPGEAIRLDAATYILPPEEIASVLANLVRRSSDSKGGTE